MTITIHLAPEEKTKLHQKAAREGQSAETTAHNALIEALEWDALDRAEAVKGIKCGLADFEQGRFRHFSEFEAEQRAKYLLQNGDQ